MTTMAGAQRLALHRPSIIQKQPRAIADFARLSIVAAPSAAALMPGYVIDNIVSNLPTSGEQRRRPSAGLN